MTPLTYAQLANRLSGIDLEPIAEAYAARHQRRLPHLPYAAPYLASQMPGMQELSWPFLKAALAERARNNDGRAQAAFESFTYGA